METQAQPKYRTITLTDRQPVKIREDEWPILAKGSYATWDGQYECQATQTRRIHITVRQHADGRAIVYGRYDYTTRWQGAKGVRHNVGHLCDRPISTAELVKAIQDVGRELADRVGEDMPDIRDVANECIAGLPAEVI